MSFLLTLAHFSLRNVKGMSRISKLCLGAKPQVSWIKTLKLFTISIKMLRDLYSSTSSDASKYRQCPSHGGRTLITVFEVSPGNCTPPHWAEQSLWHTRNCQDFLFLCPQGNAYIFSTERGKQEKEKFIKQPSVPYATPLVFSAQFLLPKLTATLSPRQLYIDAHFASLVFHLYTINVSKNLLLACWLFAASVWKSKL